MSALDSYPHDFHGSSVGITFCLPSRRRFIPNAWLLHAELNKQATAIEMHYTHCLVTVEGMNLGNLHEQIGKFGVGWIQELRLAKPDEPSVTRIEIAEKSDD
jgi:hypothetical protein